MKSNLRWLVAFGGNAIFLWILSQINHHLSALSLGFGTGPVYVVLLGLPIAFLSLRFSLKYALASAIPTALFAEAGLPIPPGTLLITATACVCVAMSVRANFNRYDKASSLLTALIMNLVFFAILTVVRPPAGGSIAGVRLAVDLLVSQVMLCALFGWFFAWQLALLKIFGFDLETELRERP